MIQTTFYPPPDANCLLNVANHCLKSTNYINVIVSDEQKHLQYMTMDQAIEHCGSLDLAIRNQIDRFSVAMDVIDRVARLQIAGARIKGKLRNMQIDAQDYAYEHGVDKPEIDQWTWL
jgi:phosphoketolase